MGPVLVPAPPIRGSALCAFFIRQTRERNNQYGAFLKFQSGDFLP